jgi:hypothetical protein
MSSGLFEVELLLSSASIEGPQALSNPFAAIRFFDFPAISVLPSAIERGLNQSIEDKHAPGSQVSRACVSSL